MIGGAGAQQASGDKASTLPNGGIAPGGKFRVFGYDTTRSSHSPDPLTDPIPSELVRQVEQAWDAHEKYLGPPRIDTMLHGKPVIFVAKRPVAERDSIVATTGNLYPTYPGKPMCGTVGAANWCQSDKFSFHYNFDHAGNPLGAGFTAHEMIHAFHNRVFAPNDGRLAHWVAEGAGNGWGFGMMERFDRKFTRRALARRFASAPFVSEAAGTHRMFGFSLGLRHYDQPLAIDHVQDLPWRHPDYPSNTGSGTYPENRDSADAFIKAAKAPDHIRGTGYLTGSFFRHMLKGRPAGAHAVRLMHSQATRPPTDARDLKQTIGWLDRGLKLAQVRDPATGQNRPVWRRGVRDVFSEMIVELADLPDLVIGSRAGRLEQGLYDQRLWARGCQKIDLSATVAATVQLKIAPVAARCLRVKLTPDAAPPNWVEVRNSPYATVPVPYLPEDFIVTVEDRANRDSCRDIDVGTRGEVLTMGGARPLAQGGCAVSWSSPYAPLKPDRAGGNGGYQTIVITNVADRAEDTVERDVTVRLVRPTVSATVSGTATPRDRGGDTPRLKKPLPKPKRSQQPALPTPGGVVIVPPPEPVTGCDAETREVFECGDEYGFGLVVGDSAEGARALTASLAEAGMLYMPAEITRGSGDDGMAENADTFHRILQQRSAPVTASTGRLMTPGGGSASGMKITVSMQQLEPGQTGTFPAKVEVEWHDGGDGGLVDSIDAAAMQSSGNGCVVVTRRKTNAQVTIAENNAGFVLGSLSTRLFENEEDAEAACRRPIRPVGTIEVAFSSPGIARSDLEPVSFDRAAVYGEINGDIVAQMLLPMDERSDFDADELERVRARRPDGSASAAGSQSGGGTCQAAVTESDRQGFAEAVVAGYGADEMPGDARRNAIAQVRPLADGVLNQQLCAWIAAGRPRSYTLPEAPE